MIVQPSKFQVIDAVTIHSSRVYAQIGGETGQDEWALQFDLLTPGWDVWGEILYTVRPGDSLWIIAKNFGTTVSSLVRTNADIDPDTLSPWQKISITYTREEVLYEVEQKMTVGAFAEKYNLPADDILTLNFMDSQESVLEEWQQLFLELTRDEAEKKWLRQQPVYIKPEGLVEELPRSEEVISWLIEDTVWTALIDTWAISDEIVSEEVVEVEIPTDPIVSTWVTQQVIISPEDTANNLDENERAIRDAKIKAEEERLAKEAEAKRQQEEAERAEQERLEKIEQEKRDAELRKKETARQTAERRAREEQERAEARKAEEARRAEQARKEQEQQAAQAEQTVISAEQTTQKIEEIVTCGAGKCLHKGKCWKLPANAQCVPEDTKNAWTCNAWYIETRTWCITEAEHKKQEEEKKKKAAVTQPVKTGTVSQRYFNPYNDGYSNGRWGGHCTHYSGRYRWKNYGIMTNWRGNGGQRYRNASAAWRQVGKTPEVWSIFVADSWSGRWSSYGHVGIVLQVDRASNSMLVEDMNYAWRYIVTQRWMPLNSKGLIGYVYPRKK